MPEDQLSLAAWKEIVSQIPTAAPKRKRGRPRRDDRAVLQGILYVLRLGIRWSKLPEAVAGVSGMTCWRRLAQWKADGTWARIEPILRKRLPDGDSLDWERLSSDTD